MKRIKFLSTNDLLYGFYLDKSAKLIIEYDLGKEVTDINDFIEKYNIVQYIENRIYLDNWTQNEINHYEKATKLYQRDVAKFFKSIDEDNFSFHYEKVEREYKIVFWELIDKYKVYKKISISYFHDFIYKAKIRDLLQYKTIVGFYGKAIRDFMLIHLSSAELLLDEYEIKHINERKPLYFPKELTNADKEKIIENYIDSTEPNLNYLHLITEFSK